MKKCNWASLDDEYFITACGANYRYISKTDEIAYCPFCGKPIKKYGKFLHSLMDRIPVKRFEEIFVKEKV